MTKNRPVRVLLAGIVIVSLTAGCWVLLHATSAIAHIREHVPAYAWLGLVVLGGVYAYNALRFLNRRKDQFLNDSETPE